MSLSHSSQTVVLSFLYFNSKKSSTLYLIFVLVHRGPSILQIQQANKILNSFLADLTKDRIRPERKSNSIKRVCESDAFWIYEKSPEFDNIVFRIQTPSHP